MVYFPPSTADVTNIRLAHWTMAEFVLLNEQNFSVVDAIYSRLSMDSLLSLSVTCFKARLSWIAYKERMFNIIKLLAKFFNDADGFRELQRRTNVVIIGDVPLLYLLRSPVDRAIFDVAVNPTHANSVVHYLMCMEGYMVWTGGQWGHDINSAYSELECIMESHHTPPSSFRGIPSFAHLDCRMPQHSHFACNEGHVKHLAFKNTVRGDQCIVRVWMAMKGTPEIVLGSKNSQYEC